MLDAFLANQAGTRPSGPPEQKGVAKADPIDGPVIFPERGSTARSALLDAMRPEISKSLGGQIEFRVSEMRSSDNAAYVRATAQRPGGGPIECGTTSECVPHPSVEAILNRRDGLWVLVDHETEPREGWRLKYCPQMPMGLIDGCDGS